jgi:hypothetical protein
VKIRTLKSSTQPLVSIDGGLASSPTNHWNSYDVHQFVSYISADSKLYFQFNVGGGSFVQVVKQDGLSLNSWHYLTIRRVSGVLTFYADGIAIGSTSANLVNPTIRDKIYLGSYSYPHYLDGEFQSLIWIKSAVSVSDLEKITGWKAWKLNLAK